MGSPEDIKNVPCDVCGVWLPQDEMHETDHDWNACSNCSIKLND